MLQISFIRDNQQLVIDRLAVKNYQAGKSIEELINLDNLRKSSQRTLDDTLARSNQIAKEVGQLFKQGKKQEAEKAKEELKLADQFDTVVVNHQLDQAKKTTLQIVTSFLEGSNEN